MNKVTYKGKDYPVRNLVIKGDGISKMQVTLATESLVNAFNQEHETVGTEANLLDDQIYFYLEDDQIELDPETICKNHLDEEFEFIEEL